MGLTHLVLPVVLLLACIAFIGALAEQVEAYLWELNQKYLGLLKTQINDKKFTLEERSEFATEFNRVNNFENAIHSGLLIVKTTFYILVCIISFKYLNWLQALVLILSLGGIIFVLHQNFLYSQRRELNPSIYLKGWRSDGSDSSKSTLDGKVPANKTFYFRTWVLVASIVLFLVQFFLFKD